jgi:hypothetical protein
MVGNGKKLQVTKIGTLHRTVYQEDGTTMDIELKGYKYVPQLQVNLFSIIKALDQGWMISNKGVIISLRKGRAKLTFDKIFKTNSGKVIGVELLPRQQNSPTKPDLAFAETPDNSDKPNNQDQDNNDNGNNNNNNDADEPSQGSTDIVPKNTQGPTWDINRMHKVFNHASEDVLRATAKERGWKITGTFETCRDCKESNAQQKAVSKTTSVKSTIPGERIFMDITSIKHVSLGGKKFWLVVVDDATSYTWSYFLAQKNHVAKTMLSFLNMLHSLSIQTRYIRCDNAGENVSLEKQLKNYPHLCHIRFEYTPRDSPQYNGKVERRIAVLMGRVRSVLTAAGLPDSLRQRLWAEAASYVTAIENQLLSIRTRFLPIKHLIWK